MNNHELDALYEGVINDVISDVKELFLDEGADVDILRVLKKSWESKMQESGQLSLQSHQRESGMSKQYNKQPQQSVKHELYGIANKNQNRVVKSEKRLESIAENTFVTSAQALSNQLQLRSGFQPGEKYRVHIVRNPNQTQMSRPLFKAEASKNVPQLDGGSSIPKREKAPGMTDSSSEDEEGDDAINRSKILKVESKTFETETDADAEKEGEEAEEPLNSDDDEEDSEDLDTIFEANNVVVCQFEKVTRVRNKWNFRLKDGIMNIDGTDHCFHKSDGSAEW